MRGIPGRVEYQAVRCRYSFDEVGGRCWLKGSYVDHSVPRDRYHSGLAKRADQVQLPMVWEYGERPCEWRNIQQCTTCPMQHANNPMLWKYGERACALH